VNGARRVTLSFAAFTLICFFLPWLQVSCPTVRGSASGLDLARAGHRVLWLVPLLMLLILLIGFVRVFWEQWPSIFALVSTVGGGLSTYLTYHERLSTSSQAGLVAAQMTVWFWLGLAASLAVAVAGLLFYARQVRPP
jgi:hypothetical protein